MRARGVLLGVVLTTLCVYFTPRSEADLGEFDANPVWPLCGRITENPPAQWVETDGCPPERWGNPNYTDTPISSTYGPRQLVSEGYRYDFHRGIDIATPLGTPVYAFADGTVKKAGPDPSYTDPLVQLRHDRAGDDKYHTNYLHMSDWTVAINDVVAKGDLIGYSGESASGFEHVHFEIRDAPPQDPTSNWSRDAVHPLGVLAYHDSGTANYQLTLDSIDTTVPLNPKVYVTLTIPMSVELDLDGFEAQVFEHQPDGSLQAVAQPGDTPVGNTIEGTGYLVEPSWYSMETWNRMYSYKNSNAVPWSSFEQGGAFESPYWAVLPGAYSANVHMDAQDPGDFQVGLFNGWSWQPSHTNANSAEYTITAGMLALVGTAVADDLCVQVRALDVHGNATEWVQYNCFLALVSAEALDGGSVLVEFSEPVDQTSAENAANYALDQGMTVNNATLQADGRSVVLTTSPLLSGLTYLLTVNNVFDLDGQVIAPDSEDTFSYVEIVSARFQDGVYPSGGYSGTRDTNLSEEDPDSNYGAETALVLDGSDPSGSGLDKRALLSWDVSSVPDTAALQSVSITLDVTNAGGEYQIYEVFQPWVEGEATWNDYENGLGWDVAGADGPEDRGTTVLGTVDTGSSGSLTVELNAGGVAAVQGWIDGSWPNYGFLLADPSSTNGLDFSSRDHATASVRPLLSIDYTDICEQTLLLTTGAWKQISLPCNPGTANQLSQVFGDDLAGTYQADWSLFKREHNDATGDIHKVVGWEESLELGRGYWIKTLVAGQSVTVRGLYNDPVEVALAGAAGGRYNIAGHPFEFDVCWADVEVINPAASAGDCAAAPTCTLTEADDKGYLSRLAYKWEGGAYAAFDGQTLGMEGMLVPWDGFWVKAFATGLQLRIPATPAAGGCAAMAETLQAAVFRKADKKKPAANWFVRLIAESGSLKDYHNVLGQLSDSVPEYDSHDLPELNPFSAPYLSIVFPHPEWGERSGNYTSEFHSLQRKIKDEWYFEVLSSEPGATVTLTWKGQESLLERAFLVDAETGKRFPVKKNNSYTFTTEGVRKGFRWLMQ